MCPRCAVWGLNFSAPFPFTALKKWFFGRVFVLSRFVPRITHFQIAASGLKLSMYIQYGILDVLFGSLNFLAPFYPFTVLMKWLFGRVFLISGFVPRITHLQIGVSELKLSMYIQQGILDVPFGDLDLLPQFNFHCCNLSQKSGLKSIAKR